MLVGLRYVKDYSPEVGDILLGRVSSLYDYYLYCAFCYNELSKDEVLTGDLKIKFMTILSNMKSLVSYEYNEDQWEADYIEKVVSMSCEYSVEDTKGYYIVIGKDNIDNIDELVNYYEALIESNNGDVDTEQIKTQLGSIYRVKVGKCNEEFRCAWSILVGAFEYLLNSASFRNGTLYLFDKIEIDNRVKYADCIVERVAYRIREVN